MNSFSPYFIGVALAYSAIALWLVFSRRPVGNQSLDLTAHSLLRGPRGVLFAGCILAALATHGYALLGASKVLGELRFGFGIAAAFIAWCAVAWYLVATLMNPRLQSLLTLALPIAAAGASCAAIWGDAQPIATAGLPWFRTHFVVAMAAYTLVAVAFLHAWVLHEGERKLRAGGAASLFSLPLPLVEMDRWLFRIVGVAFLLLTITLASGWAFSSANTGEVTVAGQKFIFAVASWLTFGALLLGRWRLGWRGATAARWTMVGFVLLLLSYFGSKFVLEILLGR